MQTQVHAYTAPLRPFAYVCLRFQGHCFVVVLHELHGGACQSNAMEVQLHVVSDTILILVAATSNLEAVQLP
jgi:hypothetical protein